MTPEGDAGRPRLATHQISSGGARRGRRRRAGKPTDTGKRNPANLVRALGSCSGTGVDGEGEPVQFCENDGKPRGAGQYGTPCPTGEECDQASGFACVGTDAGDLDSYCTSAKCSAGADCPSDHECSAVRSGRPPCEDACGFQSVPADMRCIPLDRIGPDRSFAADRSR